MSGLQYYLDRVFVFFLDGRCVATLQNKLFVRSSPNCAVEDFDIKHAQWGLQGLSCSWDFSEHCTDFEVNVLALPLLERLLTVSKAFDLLITFLASLIPLLIYFHPGIVLTQTLMLQTSRLPKPLQNRIFVLKKQRYGVKCSECYVIITLFKNLIFNKIPNYFPTPKYWKVTSNLLSTLPLKADARKLWLPRKFHIYGAKKGGLLVGAVVLLRTAKVTTKYLKNIFLRRGRGGITYGARCRSPDSKSNFTKRAR